jgi:ornithine lipid ester-linked acyl 2-hydroxylase
MNSESVHASPAPSLRTPQRDKTFQHKVRSIVETIMFSPGGDRTFYKSDEFPWVADVEAEWRRIRQELEMLMGRREEIPNFQDLSEDQRVLTEGEQWKTLWFYAYGVKADDNCARCPETVRILRKIPGMKSAMFSILAPRKYIPPHRGPYKGVLRYHLGLIVPGPEGSCRIRVGNDVRSWKEGKSLIFDDSHEHEVWCDCDSPRVVLFVDFLRPVWFPMSLVNRGIIRVLARTSSISETMVHVRQQAREVKQKAEAARN